MAIKIKNILYKDIDAFLESYCKSNFEPGEEYVIQNESIGNDAIIAFGPVLRVIDKGLICIEGTYCNYDEKTGEMEPDWSLTLIYQDVPDDEFDIEAYDYYEQDDPVASIHNYIRATGHEKKKELKIA